MTRYDPLSPRFHRLGRFNPDETRCALWWSGSGLSTVLDCKRLEFEIDCPDNEHTPFMAVTVDGAPIARLPLRVGLHRYDLLGNMEKGMVHEVAVLRDSQPHDTDVGVPVITAVYTDGEPQAPAPKPLLVEFIGDSLTVGEGLIGAKDAMEWRMAWCSNTPAFPTLASDLMNAERRVFALGGWGCWRAWDGDPNGNIGRIYERLCAVTPGGDVPYDFSAQRAPDAVVVNLGTNDASAVSKLPEAERPAALEAVSRRAEALLALVRRHAPEARILWAYGLCGDALAEPLRSAVERRRQAGDSDVEYLTLTDCGDDIGSRQHPGYPAHKRAAREIAQALKLNQKRG